MPSKGSKTTASHFPTQPVGRRRGGVLRSLRMPLAFAAIGCVGIAGSYFVMTSLYMPDAAANEEHLAQVAEDREIRWDSDVSPMPRKDHLAGQDRSWKAPEPEGEGGEPPADTPPETGGEELPEG